MNDEVLNRTIVLVGKTGNGKSATGNTLLGRTHFRSTRGANSITRNIETATCNPTNDNCCLNLTIIDTPGFFDCRNVAKTAVKLHEVVAYKPHVFLLVLKEGRLTDEEKYTLDLLRIIYGNIVFKHIIVVVTHGNNFDDDAEFQQFVTSENVKLLVECCGGRVMKIENKPKEFNFPEFRRLMGDLKIEYSYEHCSIHESVIKKYCNENHGEKPVVTQLEEMSSELKKLLPWDIGFIYGGLIGGLIGVVTGFAFVVKRFW